MPVGISGCFDDRRLYNLEAKWGVYGEDGKVTDVKTSLSNLHGDVPISDKVTCTDIDIEQGYSIFGVQVESTTSAITKMSLFLSNPDSKVAPFITPSVGNDTGTKKDNLPTADGYSFFGFTSQTF